MSTESASQNFRGKRVALGVCGGIAAYKAAEILRGLQRAGCTVRVAMTKRACEFITPLTFRALSGVHVLVDDYAPDNPDPIAHITFSQTVDLFLVAPATANIIAKFARGIADDFLTTTYLASNAPVVVAPAMNTTMWNHPATQRNLQQLRDDGVYIVEPDAGEMACGTVGPGRLSEPEIVVAAALDILRQAERSPVKHFIQNSFVQHPPLNIQTNGDDATTNQTALLENSLNENRRGENTLNEAASQDLAGERILITAGATREEIDPVRFLSNRSSGRMGFALAEAARARGADIVIVAGATAVPPPDGVRVVRVTTAEQMRAAVLEEIDASSVLIAAAAVTDYRPAAPSPRKIKKSDDALTLTLEPTPDVLAEAARARHDGLLLIGFAAETDDVLENARLKLERKGLDAIVANDITRDGAGFDTDTNIITLLARDRDTPLALPLLSKLEAAHRILDEIVRLRKAKMV
ncbi:MAG TPA: bifunctional phosphopantothenoylcysteine decarboxylase/phosphopantothenate synthase [Pyrinomonadaceae bacterium]|jgi:phosphopantothenoylcysteine decarboxylase/phosphopantothenate--cysteine ligase